METSGVESFGTNLAVGEGYTNLHPPKPGCWLEVCRVQPWDGSPNVAGVGVRWMFNLFITVSLTITDARNIHTPDMPRHGLSLRTRHDTLRLEPGQDTQRLSFMKRTLLAIHHSTGSFLSASFVFCIAMLLASLLSEVDDNSNARGNTWALLLIMPVSSVLPVVVLQLGTSDTLRRVKGRMALWSLVFALNLALLIRTIVAAFDVSEEEKSKFKFSCSAWEISCLDTYYILPMPIISWVIAGSVCLSMGFYIIISAVASLRRHGPRKYVYRPGKPWWSMIILAFVAMWTFIGWFMRFAFLVRNSARSSSKDKE
jgi:hypothetical protein